MSGSTLENHDWSPERLEQTGRAICDPETLNGLLRDAAHPATEAIRDVLYEAMRGHGLTLPQVAVLLQITDPEQREKVKTTARKVHERLFRRRVRLVDPVCPTNRCVNDCLYCPLRRSNGRLRRASQTTRDLQREVTALVDEGHRHLTLVFGEDRSGIPYVRDMVQAAYGVRSGPRQVRRVDVNLNSSHPEDLAWLSQVDRLGTYHLYQETYHPETYRRLHPDGPKADYYWRLTSHDRACQAGVLDVGLGVLLGAYDFRFDILALLAHATYLLETYDTAAEVISLPRMIPVAAAPASQETEWQVSDDDFAFIVAVTRLATPLTEVVLVTPAATDTRRDLYSVGISQVSVGSASYPGVYSADGAPEAAGSLNIGRPRNLEQLVYRMCEVGFVPNFCVDCYVRIRELLKHGGHDPERCPTHRCSPNSLLALKEYLVDFASPETQRMGERLIQVELASLPQKLRDTTLDVMEEVEAGFRGQML